MIRPAYRVRQFIHTLRPGDRHRQLAVAAEHLPPPQLLLFRGMPAPDRAHGVRVLRTLQEAGETDADLLAAALLHDVGKSTHPLRPWERALIVLLERMAPFLTERLGRSEPEGWGRPFAVAARHPEWGAALVEEIGGSPRLVRLIRHHQDGPRVPAKGDFDRALQSLQAADDRN